MPEFTDDQLRYHAAKAGYPAKELAAELLRAREEVATLGRTTYCAYCGEQFPTEQTDSAEQVGAHIATCPEHPMRQIEAERVALRTAITAALRELGVPTISYPAPVANAVGILEAALEGEGDGD